MKEIKITKSFRLSEELYEQAAVYASNKGVSLNRLWCQAMQELIFQNTNEMHKYLVYFKEDVLIEPERFDCYLSDAYQNKCYIALTAEEAAKHFLRDTFNSIYLLNEDSITDSMWEEFIRLSLEDYNELFRNYSEAIEVVSKSISDYYDELIRDEGLIHGRHTSCVADRYLQKLKTFFPLYKFKRLFGKKLLGEFFVFLSLRDVCTVKIES